MTELELLIDFHLNAVRQGPGSDEDTRKALSLLDIDPSRPLKVADIGCGTGAQTLTLAGELKGEITAVDLFPDFLTMLEQRASRPELLAEITTVEASMDDLPFQDNEFDLIWSEGAVYNIGFEAGIKGWRRFLKPGGFIAVSEITWKTARRPREIEEHWQTEYPEIDTASGKIKILEEYGFSPVGFFFLPEESWIESYYAPMEARFTAFAAKHGDSEAVNQLIAQEQEEIRLYREYKEYFSYGFYIARKLE